MTVNRRRLIGAALGLAATGALPVRGSRAAPRAGGGANASTALRNAIDLATRAGRPYLVPPGVVRLAGLELPDGAHLIGAPGATRLTLDGDGPLLTARGAERITLSGLTFDGADRALGPDRGLIDLSNVGQLSISDCAIVHAGGVGLRLRACGGRVERNDIADIRAGGIFSIDATGLAIADNSLARCGDNGVQIWRSAAGDDGTRVSGNRIVDIANASGGSGQYGNGISVFRAGGVVVANNVIRRCAYSAIRNNSGAGVTIVGNNCATLGETAIFAEFGFEGCVIASNSIDGALSGVQMVNFAHAKGHAAVCSGNIIRNLKGAQSGSGREFGYQCAIKVEADATVSGNVIEGAPWVGILVGWGASLRDVVVDGNVVRDAPIGIGVSVVEGAGSAIIVNNLISGASRGAILGMKYDEAATEDLARGGTAPRQLRIGGNQAI
jgi:uncharacterized secreted repeat protein (TIGR03808 family)